MLVLSRGRTEKIVFPSLGITIEILRVSGNRVRIGIDAPTNVQVLRSELADQFHCDDPQREPKRRTRAKRGMRVGS